MACGLEKILIGPLATRLVSWSNCSRQHGTFACVENGNRRLISHSWVEQLHFQRVWFPFPAVISQRLSSMLHGSGRGSRDPLELQSYACSVPAVHPKLPRGRDSARSAAVLRRSPAHRVGASMRRVHDFAATAAPSWTVTPSPRPTPHGRSKQRPKPHYHSKTLPARTPSGACSLSCSAILSARPSWRHASIPERTLGRPIPRRKQVIPGGQQSRKRQRPISCRSFEAEGVLS